MTWHELEVGRRRIRWRKTEDDTAHFAAGYEIEVYRDEYEEWSPVESWQARDWFVIGIEAARKLQEGEQGRLFE